MAELRAEFRKLLSVRSTYFLTLIVVVLTCLFTYTGTSGHYTGGPPPGAGHTTAKVQVVSQTKRVLDKNLPPDELQTNVLEDTGAAAFIAIVIVLLMGHEFRYNTITYTLTASRSRSKVLLAKIITGICYAIFCSAIAIVVTIILTHIAVSVKGLYLPHQIINWTYVSARLMGYIIGFAMLGLAVTTLVRNLTASIVALFGLPTLDAIIGAFLMHSNIEPARFLPYSALSRVGSESADSGITATSMPSIAHALVVFSLYLVPVWIFAWYLFLRRDAN